MFAKNRSVSSSSSSISRLSSLRMPLFHLPSFMPSLRLTFWMSFSGCCWSCLLPDLSRFHCGYTWHFRSDFDRPRLFRRKSTLLLLSWCLQREDLFRVFAGAFIEHYCPHRTVYHCYSYSFLSCSTIVSDYVAVSFAVVFIVVDVVFLPDIVAVK